MKLPILYTETDTTESQLYPWHFCYLHGDAEFRYDPENGSAPDLFLADEPMPVEAGTYACEIRGLPAVAVIAQRHGGLAGRVALVKDTEALTHALDVEAWA